MRHGQFSAWVTLDDTNVKCEEYGFHSKEDHKGNVTAICYIEVAPGQRIASNFCSTIEAPPPHFYCGETYLDGYWIGGKFLEANRRYYVSHTFISPTLSAPLIIGKLETTDDDDEAVKLEQDELLSLGTLSVKISEGRELHTENRTFPADLPDTSGKLHEKSKKATLIGARGSFGAAEPSVEQPSSLATWWERVDGTPQVRFEFRYRSAAALLLVQDEDGKYLELGNASKTSAAVSASAARTKRSISAHERSVGPSKPRRAAKKQALAPSQSKAEDATSRIGSSSRTASGVVDMTGDSDSD